eukprot:CAMPEP_0196666348 /NCGR_PEP_ID=MMETSP1086-20130531/64463_1 /TAXON_ID=77921 /ORGANISM="Cyanoptyche  gloeocystis , Strain SAG4.97" /LENGTH=46 /DNA_ID= /DNA_START= /DNA_END= /DNA_ORIENTATION=
MRSAMLDGGGMDVEMVDSSTDERSGGGNDEGSGGSNDEGGGGEKAM